MKTFLALVLSAVASTQTGLPHIGTAEAMRQIVRKVDPVWPAAAVAAKIGGFVVADAVVGVDGAVESVTILSGDPLLHQATIAAVKQWRFRPFLVQGRPVRVMAVVEVRFPDPRVEEESRRALAQADAAMAARGPLAVPAPRPLPMSVVGGVPCLGGGCGAISAAELSAVTPVPPNSAVWLITADATPSFYLKSTSANSAIRRGPIVQLAQAPDGSGWARLPPVAEWVQIVDGRTSYQVANAEDDNVPIIVHSIGPPFPLSDADLIGLVRFLASEGAKTRVADHPSPRLGVDVQPWRIMEVGPSTVADSVRVLLRDPKDRSRGQYVSIRKGNGGWTVAAVGRQPTTSETGELES